MLLFFCIFDQVNAALVRHLSKVFFKISKHLNASVKNLLIFTVNDINFKV